MDFVVLGGGAGGLMHVCLDVRSKFWTRNNKINKESTVISKGD